jgi:PBP1b-binding outer membrane lipoprotein LpoB
MKKILIIIVFTSMLLSGCSNTKKTPDYTMTSHEIYHIFDENEIQASLTYEDKLIKVDGYFIYFR